MSGLLSRFKTWGQKTTEVETEDVGEANGAENDSPALATAGATEENEPVVLSPIEVSLLQGEIIEQLRTIYDPEIPVNIYELGLIYDIDVTPDGSVDVKMTLTSPGCPVAGTLPPEVQEKVASVPGVIAAKVDVVWEPTWNMDMMSDEAKLELGLF